MATMPNKMLLRNKMDQKTKQRFFTFLYVFLILAVIGTCIFLITYLTGESATCLADPIQYYSDKTNQLCYCISENGWLQP